MAKLLIENRGRDQKNLGKIEVKGTIHNVTLGSADDAIGAPVLKSEDGSTSPGEPGTWSDEFPNPVQPLDAQVWDAYLNDKARGPVIKHWLNTKEITVGRAL